nr:auxin-responsive protein SAUR66-like [Nicotiana tomentosiformis]
MACAKFNSFIENESSGSEIETDFRCYLNMHRENSSGVCISSAHDLKGHFVVPTIDRRRFVIPLAYLENEIIRQLLNMSEEEFGLPSGGAITLPCDWVFMDYIISLIKKGVAAGDLRAF